MGKRAAQGLPLYLPLSQDINKFTGNTVQMRTSTHTVLHYAQGGSACICVSARINEKTKQAPKRVWLERNGMMGERASSWENAPLASISSFC